MFRTLIFCAFVCICSNCNAQDPSPVEKAKIQDAWLEALVQFDGNREHLAEKYAVIIETDFAGERKSFNGNVLLFNRRFLLRRSEGNELFAAARFDSHATELSSGWLEIQGKSEGHDYFYRASNKSLPPVNGIDEDTRPLGLKLGDQKKFDPTYLPISTVPLIIVGQVDAKYFDSLVQQEGLVASSKKNDLTIFRYRQFREYQEVKFSESQGGMPVETITKVFPEKSTVSWDQAALYSVVQTKWAKINDRWYPKEMGLKFYAAAASNDPDQSEWTEVWRFTWLDLDQVSNLLTPQQILKTLAKSPPNPEIFSGLKKYSLK